MSDVVYTVDKAVNFPELILGLNQASEGWFIGFLLIFIWVIILSTTMLVRYPFNRAMVFSNVIVVTLSVMFWAVGALSTTFMVLPLALLMITIGVLLFGN